MAITLPGRARELEPLLSAALRELALEAELDQQARLLSYVLLMERWNAVHNLSASSDAASLLRRHVIDCLAIIRPLLRYAGRRSLKVLDAGTGAGLPAVVLAIMLPGWTVTAVDSVGKKVAFLRQVAGELGLANLRPLHARLETGRRSEGSFDVVTSRALSSLRLLVDTTKQMIEPNGVWVAMKGRMPEAEIRNLPADCQLFHVEPLLVPGLEEERCLVWMKPTH